MAQVRDKQTSQFLFEGTPLEAALVAKELGFNEVIFDDVTLDFDPQAVIDFHEATKDAASDAGSPEYVAKVEADGTLDTAAVSDAVGALQAARDAVENFQG